MALLRETAQIQNAIERAAKLHQKNRELRAVLKKLKEELREARAKTRRYSKRLNPHLILKKSA